MEFTSHNNSKNYQVKLRSWLKTDLEALIKHANNPKIAQFMTNGFPHPYTKEHGEKWLEMAASTQPAKFLCIEIDNEAAGGIGIHLQQDIMCKNAELGYWLSEMYWGKGIMPLAVKLAVDYGFRNFDITRIYARPFGNNPASQRVLEKCGFHLDARIEKSIFKNGEYLDELIYAVRKS